MAGLLYRTLMNQQNRTKIPIEKRDKWNINCVDLYFNDDDVYMLHTCNVASVVKMWLFSRWDSFALWRTLTRWGRRIVCAGSTLGWCRLVPHNLVKLSCNPVVLYLKMHCSSRENRSTTGPPEWRQIYKSGGYLPG